VTTAGRQRPGGIEHYPFSPKLKVANFALLLPVRRTEKRNNDEKNLPSSYPMIVFLLDLRSCLAELPIRDAIRLRSGSCFGAAVSVPMHVRLWPVVVHNG